MSDFTTRPASEAKDGADTASSDEAGSSSNGKRSQSSFWARAARILRPAQGSARLREDLADALIAGATDDDAFSPDERAMLHNILRFREVRVEDVMVPRADIEAVDQNITIGELMILFEESGRSRMPVYAETLDDPRGMVHIRDLLSYVAKQARNKRRAGNGKAAAASAATPAEKPARSAKPNFDLSRVDLQKTLAEAGIIRKILFVPPSMLASDLLRRMQVNRTQMALVIDEYGGTDGLASHEDIVEMVVGDIDDEHDDDEVMFKRVSEDVFVADARVELEEIAAAIGSDFDISEQVDEVDTLGGLIFSALGRIPVRGEVVQALPGFEFHILDADPRRIKKVRITRKRHAARRRPTKADGEGGGLDRDLPSPDTISEGSSAERNAASQ
ncbi:hemolysin family protein [Agrobacterium sp. SHOUNA12C]|uniref:Hemolysin protein n=2 Tax=Rhizobium rhizogenes TaxID=359 RepID=B9J8B3_RHIR8|nr:MULTISPECIES: hemolysin family protein [Rhizobium]ACM25300.1 hemolysin protein [Rhizobium rhizogenes K84]KAA6486959.1 HlyC/CorC family transporter [Agrobacterium sp. ICMP 7243]MCJ9725228.1 hemolysin family protein [Agrobacterium sp. BETTINA12B]MCJ9760116.1 hemolysin family protein [Agrobacterium sp. SHOUNA12C]OCI97928.1 magnesium/cobalt efflux protein [Agrobacterium sp. 13-626]OCJ21653.1 magnesium/cobalt efflux protein [Agrobacterium sp. B131/95]OCJ26900.1 magnesium/cobalt efflux protein 